MNTPVELMETAFPVRIERYEINPDSGGAGRYRGGCGRSACGACSKVPMPRAPCALERMTSPPFGLAGGQAGAAAVVTLTTPDARPVICRARGICRPRGLGRDHDHPGPAASARSPTAILPPSATICSPAM
jgi:N-methylhydantoinase B/oxoprolinase/acetone carboxylase alpha subunit